MRIPEVAYDISDLAVVGREDFKYSFLYSQGSSATQHLIFELLGAIYHHNLNGDQYQYLSNSMKLEDERPRLEPGHLITAKVTRKSIRISHTAESNRFKASLALRATDPFDSKAETRVAAWSLGKDLIRNDAHYQQSSRGIGSDKHKSYFRQYVLLAEPPASASFSAMFDMARQLWITESGIASDQSLEALAGTWEENHPGHSFWNDDSSTQ